MEIGKLKVTLEVTVKNNLDNLELEVEVVKE